MKNWRGIFMVFGAFLAQLTLGTIYTFGNMSPYLASYMRVYRGHAVTLADMTWIYAAMVACQGLLMVLGGILERRLGSRITSFLGCALMSSGVALTYCTIDMSFLMVVLTYGVMYGMGISFAYISFLTCGMKWFPMHKGIVNGIIIGGFGLGAFIFNQVQTEFLNPDNYLPDEDGYFTEDEVLKRVPNVFLLLGAIYAVMQFIGCFLASKPPSTIAEEIAPLLQDDRPNIQSVSGDKVPICLSKSQSVALNVGGTEFYHVNLTPLQMLKTKEFYLLWWTFFLNGQTVYFCNAMYKAYGQTFIQDDHFLAMIGAVAAIFNAGGRIFWGVVVDSYSYKVSMRSLCIAVGVFLLTMPAAQWVGKFMYGTWMCGLYVALSGTYVIMPTIVSRTFGPEHAGTNYGLVFSNSVASGPLTAILTQELSDALGYTGIFYMLTAFSAISLLLTIPFEEKLMMKQYRKTRI